jgi:hypothetical protein
MRTFVFDEWLWSDLRGESGEDAQRKSFSLLETVCKNCDRLVTVEGSHFLQKFFDLAKEVKSIGDPRRIIIKAFKVQFLYNSEKLHCLKKSDLLELPPEIEDMVKEDDKYLVHAYLTGRAELLVTTDNPLMKTLKDYCIKCVDKTMFISDYLGAEE